MKKIRDPEICCFASMADTETQAATICRRRQRHFCINLRSAWMLAPVRRVNIQPLNDDYYLLYHDRRDVHAVCFTSCLFKDSHTGSSWLVSWHTPEPASLTTPEQLSWPNLYVPNKQIFVFFWMCDTVTLCEAGTTDEAFKEQCFLWERGASGCCALWTRTYLKKWRKGQMKKLL